MGTASGVYKQVTYKVESVYGTIPSAGSAQSIRRVTSSLDMSKETYQSNEIRTDFQVADMRHGVKRVAGAISGELQAGTYKDFMAAALKKAWATTTAITGASITIAGTAGAWTITRAAGSYLTDGVKIGDVVALTAGSFVAGNLNKNIMVTNVTALVITGLVLNASVLTAEGPIAAATVTIRGKKSIIPQTGHTDLSYSIEHWYPDVPASEVFNGCKVSKIAIGLPPTGMATCSVEFMGQERTSDTSQYFTAPTAITTTGCLAAVNGVIRAGGATVANITGLTIDIVCGQSGEPVVGSDVIPFLAAGRVLVSGQFTATFDSTTYRDAFDNETEISIFAAFTADNTALSDFVAFGMSRVKVGGASKDDGEKTITQTFPFTALLNTAGGAAVANDMTTISIQDSAA